MNVTMNMLGGLLGVVLGLGSVGAAHAEEGGGTRPRVEETWGWVVTPAGGGKPIGTESLKVVASETGKWFASGQTKIKGKAKVAQKTHLQRDVDGRLVQYKRAAPGAKGAGVKIFEFEGKLRWAPVNGPGKAVDLAPLMTGFVGDAGLWHLYATWKLPKSCVKADIGYVNGATQAVATASFNCTGSRKVYDAGKKAMEVHGFAVSGAPEGDLTLWVNGAGNLIAAENKTKSMLREKFSWEAGKVTDADADPDDAIEADEKKSIKDRGVGE